MAYQESGGVLEWNSNMAVLKRVSDTIDSVNDARYRMTRFDDYGMVLAEAEEVLSHLICLYKEIYVELTPDETKIWKELSELRDKLRAVPPKPTTSGKAYWRTSIDKLDDLDLRLRMLAKRRGFLASNKVDVSQAGLMR